MNDPPKAEQAVPRGKGKQSEYEFPIVAWGSFTGHRVAEPTAAGVVDCSVPHGPSPYSFLIGDGR